jgi:hypothetical protein
LTLSIMAIILVAITCMTMSISAASSNAVSVKGGNLDATYNSLEGAVTAINAQSKNVVYTITLNENITLDANLTTPKWPTIITAKKGVSLNVDPGVTIKAGNTLKFENITLNASDAYLDANGKQLIMGEGITGGFRGILNSLDLTIYSGTYGDVGSDSDTSNFAIYGGTIESLYINGQTFNATIAGGKVDYIYIYASTSNLTYIDGTIGNIYDGAASRNVYLISGASNSVINAYYQATERFDIGKGLYKSVDASFALYSMKITIDPKIVKTKVEKFDEATMSWKNWDEKGAFTDTGSYDLRLRFTGTRVGDTDNPKTTFVFERSFSFFVWDLNPASLLTYLLDRIFGGFNLGGILGESSNLLGLLEQIFGWLFGNSGILSGISFPSFDNGLLDQVFSGLTGGFDGLFGNGLDLSGLLGGNGLDLSGLLGGNGLDLSGLLGGNGLDLSGLLGGNGFDLTGLLGGSGFDLTGLLGGSGLDLTGLLGGFLKP